MANFCKKCGNALSADTKFCKKCGKPVAAAAQPAPQRPAAPPVQQYRQQQPARKASAARAPDPARGPISFSWQSLISGLKGIGALLKKPSALLPTIVVMIVQTILSFAKLDEPLNETITALSFVFFAQGGMYGGFIGAVGGIIGRGIYAWAVSSIVMSLFNKGKKQPKRAEPKRRVHKSMPLLILGIGAGLFAYNFLSGDASMENAIIGVTSAIACYKASKKKQGFMIGFVSSFTKGRLARDGVSRIVFGIAAGMVFGTLSSMATSGYMCYAVGTVLAIIGLILSLSGKSAPRVASACLLVMMAVIIPLSIVLNAAAVADRAVYRLTDFEIIYPHSLPGDYTGLNENFSTEFTHTAERGYLTYRHVETEIAYNEAYIHTGTVRYTDPPDMITAGDTVSLNINATAERTEGQRGTMLHYGSLLDVFASFNYEYASRFDNEKRFARANPRYLRGNTEGFTHALVLDRDMGNPDTDADTFRYTIPYDYTEDTFTISVSVQYIYLNYVFQYTYTRDGTSSDPGDYDEPWTPDEPWEPDEPWIPDEPWEPDDPWIPDVPERERYEGERDSGGHPDDHATLEETVLITILAGGGGLIGAGGGIPKPDGGDPDGDDPDGSDPDGDRDDPDDDDDDDEEEEEEEEEPNTCSNCGADIPKGTVKCEKCGERLCPNCGTALPGGAIFCEECKSNLCANCGSAIYKGSAFCRGCGSKLCTNCGNAIAKGAVMCDNCRQKFCPSCGKANPPDRPHCRWCLEKMDIPELTFEQQFLKEYAELQRLELRESMTEEEYYRVWDAHQQALLERSISMQKLAQRLMEGEWSDNGYARNLSHYIREKILDDYNKTGVFDPQKMAHLNGWLDSLKNEKVSSVGSVFEHSELYYQLKGLVDGTAMSIEEVARGETGLAIAANIGIGLLGGEAVLITLKSYYIMKDYVEGGGDSAFEAFGESMKELAKEVLLEKLVGGAMKGAGAAGKTISQSDAMKILTSDPKIAKALELAQKKIDQTGKFLNQEVTWPKGATKADDAANALKNSKLGSQIDEARANLRASEMADADRRLLEGHQQAIESGKRHADQLKEAAERMKKAPNDPDAVHDFHEAVKRAQQDKFAIDQLNTTAPDELRNAMSTYKNTMDDKIVRNTRERLAQELNVKPEDIIDVRCTNRAPGSPATVARDLDTTYRIRTVDPVTNAETWTDIPASKAKAAQNIEAYHQWEGGIPTKNGQIDYDKINDFNRNMDYSVLDKKSLDAYGNVADKAGSDLAQALDRGCGVKNYYDVSAISSAQQYKSTEWFQTAEVYKNAGNYAKAAECQMEGIRQATKQYDNLVVRQANALNSAGVQVKIPDKVSDGMSVLKRVGSEPPNNLSYVEANAILKNMGYKGGVDEVVTLSAGTTQILDVVAKGHGGTGLAGAGLEAGAKTAGDYLEGTLEGIFKNELNDLLF